jgi:hypothetical protein
MLPNSPPDTNGVGSNGFSLTFTATRKKAVVLKGAASGIKEEVHKELIVGLTGIYPF